MSPENAASELETEEARIRQVYDLIANDPDITDAQIAEILVKEETRDAEA